MPTALIVDDEAQMTSIVAFALETDGFETVTCSSGKTALIHVERVPFDIIILDRMLPDISGTTVAKHIRSQCDTPIVMLTALGEVEDRLAGFEAGVDDYISKPFSPQELRARVRAIMRRTLPKQHDRSKDLEFGRMRVHPHSPKVAVDGKLVDLTETEVRLLRALIQQPRHVHTVRELLGTVWGTSAMTGGRNMVKTAIYRLRKKLEAAGLEEPIISVRGRGYTIRHQMED
ncbi:MAG: response regulator [Actinomycetaceae bacterium]|nr:response regulator [Actinomycetaceae bacterium]